MSEQRADHKYQMPDGSYPIDQCTGDNSVHSAALLAHHSKTYSFAQVKAHVMKAKAGLGCPDSVLPSTWTDSGRAMVDVLERRDNRGVVEPRSDPGKIGGYGAVFNRQSRSLTGAKGQFVEQVDPGAFDHNRGRNWPGVVSRFNHDPNMLLGTTDSGTLWLRTDEVGLDYEVQPPRARADVLESVQRRDIRHSSFTFKVLEERWDPDDAGLPLRTLLRVQLFEVGPVTAPAYPDTSAALRSLAMHLGVDLEELENRAADGRLIDFFRRTDVEGQAPKRSAHFGPAAKMALLARRKDPWLR